MFLEKLEGVLSQSLPKSLKIPPGRCLGAALVILVFGREISGYLSGYNVDKWWDYYIIVQRIAILLILIEGYKRLILRSWLLTELLLAVIIQDLIDRTVFSIKGWSMGDLLSITTVFTILLLRWMVKKKKG